MSMSVTGHILLAEDEDHIAKLVSFTLSKEGWVITRAIDGQQAIEHARDQVWSLIILDVNMPRKTGWEALKELRANDHVRCTPVLMLTADGFRRDLADAAGMGTTAYLAKPFVPSELAKTVSRIAAIPTQDVPGWQSDPELRALREEFVRSMDERRALLARAAARGSAEEIQQIAHKVAGIAASYGFLSLTLVGEAIDDALAEAAVSAATLKRASTLLDECLQSVRAGGDDRSFAQDPRLAELISVYEQSRAGSTSGSS